jgi:hypothetical protein
VWCTTVVCIMVAMVVSGCAGMDTSKYTRATGVLNVSPTVAIENADSFVQRLTTAPTSPSASRDSLSIPGLSVQNGSTDEDMWITWYEPLPSKGLKNSKRRVIQLRVQASKTDAQHSRLRLRLWIEMDGIYTKDKFAQEEPSPEDETSPLFARLKRCVVYGELTEPDKSGTVTAAPSAVPATPGTQTAAPTKTDLTPAATPAEFTAPVTPTAAPTTPIPALVPPATAPSAPTREVPSS